MLVLGGVLVLAPSTLGVEKVRLLDLLTKKVVMGKTLLETCGWFKCIYFHGEFFESSPQCTVGYQRAHHMCPHAFLKTL